MGLLVEEESLEKLSLFRQFQDVEFRDDIHSHLKMT